MSQQPPWQPQQTPSSQSQWGQNVPPQSQPSLYNQPTQATPAQFQQSSSNYIPPSKKPGLWGWYKSRTRRVKLFIGCGTFLALLLFFFCIGTALGRANSSSYAHQSVTDQTHTSQAGQTPTTYPLAPGGYLASGSNYVLFLQFTNTNGMLSGEWNEDDVVPSTSTNVMQVNPFHTSFSALLNGTQFNLNVNGHTYAGSFDGNNVTIEFPQQDGTLAPITLTPSSINDYTTAISKLQSTVNQENQKLMTARQFADFQTEVQKLIPVWDKKPFAVRQEFINLFVKKAVLTIVATHWLRLDIIWSHPAWQTDTLYMHRNHGSALSWKDEEKEIIRTLYPTATQTELLQLLPEKSWAAIVTEAHNLGIKRAVPKSFIIPRNLTWSDWQFMQEHNIAPKDRGTKYVSSSSPTSDFSTLGDLLKRLRLLFSTHNIA